LFLTNLVLTVIHPSGLKSGCLRVTNLRLLIEYNVLWPFLLLAMLSLM
jgi:hypothetical protein